VLKKRECILFDVALSIDVEIEAGAFDEIGEWEMRRHLHNPFVQHP
jgi:hypothetical protein